MGHYQVTRSTSPASMYAVSTQGHHSNSLEVVQYSLSSLIPDLLQYLTIKEEADIYKQFQGPQWKPNHQVLWSGVLREEAQKWADDHDMQTLATAMGPLMDPRNPLCLQTSKSHLGWTKYIKGASVVFAWCILRGEKVTVLSPPPPNRFHPSGLTNFQLFEEPILKLPQGGGATLHIEMVHPRVKGAEDFSYQIWPFDETDTWIAAFGTVAPKNRRWRAVKNVPRPLIICKDIETNEQPGVQNGAGSLTRTSRSGGDLPAAKGKKKGMIVNEIEARESGRTENSIQYVKSEVEGSPKKACYSDTSPECKESPGDRGITIDEENVERPRKRRMAQKT